MRSHSSGSTKGMRHLEHCWGGNQENRSRPHSRQACALLPACPGKFPQAESPPLGQGPPTHPSYSASAWGMALETSDLSSCILLQRAREKDSGTLSHRHAEVSSLGAGNIKHPVSLCGERAWGQAVWVLTVRAGEEVWGSLSKYSVQPELGFKSQL